MDCDYVFALTATCRGSVATSCHFTPENWPSELSILKLSNSQVVPVMISAIESHELEGRRIPRMHTKGRGHKVASPAWSAIVLAMDL